MKGKDWLIIGGLAIAAYFLYTYFKGLDSGYSGDGGGGGSNQPPLILPPLTSPPSTLSSAPGVYTTKQIPTGVILPSKGAPMVQQTTSVITMGTRTQVGKPAYSGRTTPYIMPITGTYKQQTQAQRINTILNPGLLKANIGMIVKPMTTADFPVGTPQHPATPKYVPKGVLMPGLLRK